MSGGSSWSDHGVRSKLGGELNRTTIWVPGQCNCGLGQHRSPSCRWKRTGGQTRKFAEVVRQCRRRNVRCRHIVRGSNGLFR